MLLECQLVGVQEQFAYFLPEMVINPSGPFHVSMDFDMDFQVSLSGSFISAVT
jgi:hypothetical protein